MNAPLQKQLADKAVAAFWASTLSDSSTPTTDDWSRGTSQATKAAIEALLGATQSKDFDDEFGEVSQRVREQLPTTIGQLVPDLRIPQPPPHLELSAWRLALTAGLGGVLGLLALTPATRFLLDMKDMGLLIGGPLGAGLVVWLSIRVANDSFLKTVLASALGVTVAADVAWMIAQSSPVGRIWSFISRAKSGGASKRWMAYVLVALILLLAKREQRFDAAAADPMVRAQIETWAGWFLKNVGAFIASKTSDELPVGVKFDQLLPALADLRRADALHQPTAVRQLFLALSTVGIEVGPAASEVEAQGQPRTLTWSDELANEYETFGEVKPGQLVEIMIDPVRVNDQVQVKGTVRRYFP